MCVCWEGRRGIFYQFTISRFQQSFGLRFLKLRYVIIKVIGAFLMKLFCMFKKNILCNYLICCFISFLSVQNCTCWHIGFHPTPCRCPCSELADRQHTSWLLVCDTVHYLSCAHSLAKIYPCALPH